MSSFIKFILLSLCGLLITHQVFAAWSSDWDTQQKISINTSGLQSTINNVPVLVRLHSGNFDFTGAKLDGADLRFIAADDKTELKFYLEKYDATNELAVAWVVLPQLSAANNDVYITLYSGNENASAASDPAVLNDATLQARFAFLETSLLKDSSHQLTASGTFTAVKAGLIAGSAAFTDSPLTFSVTQAPDATQGLTWSVWLKPVTLPQTGTIFQSGNVSLVLNGSTLNLQAGNTKAEGGTLKASDWHHIAIVLESGKVVVYVNGSPVIQTPVTDVKVDANLSVGQGLQAEIDELQWAAEARSADWLRFASQTQGMDAKLVTVAAAGEDSEGEEGDVNYISILVNSLTVDAKVVIAILAVMFAISAWVMVSKGMLVTRTDKDNRLFLQRFQQSNANDLLTLDQSGTYLHSTLFGLYQAGLREIKKREHAGIVQLSGASIDAIKAAVDADLVRETQRMNGMMVLLTIAISGGPFLGLLGTVVGVMITFAAIAAAGDVNVNAIAPGIAAALLATVAGLGVAIPALFGYNYLASRIKNITIAMQIFVDEFITRTAELYGKE